MNRDKEADSVSLLAQKYKAAKALLTFLKVWESAPEYDDKAAFSANMDKRQKLLDELVLLDRKLSGLSIRKDRTPEASELKRKTDEILTQIQLAMTNDIKQVENNMNLYLSHAKKLRDGKSGLMAYKINGSDTHRQRYNLIG